MNEIFLWVESLISGKLPLAFLILSGVLFTLKTRGLQFREFFRAMKFSLSIGSKKEKGISSFGAVCNSLAATVGTGNIAGVAAAISVGGAGSVFWMWMSGFLSMVVKALEITLAVNYRTKEEKAFKGGTVYYIIGGLAKGFSPLAAIFAFVGIFSALTTGNITQINACVSAIGGSFWVKFVTGIIFCVVTALIVSGGIQKITRFTTSVLPLMAVLYILLCLGVIIKNISVLDDVLMGIFKGAFSPLAVTGGAVGSVLNTVLTGAKKGIFSNEAGLGTAGIAHASAEDANVVTQGYFGIFEVFADTLLICTLTALTILCSGVIIDYNKVASSELVSQALSTVYGGFSSGVLSLMLCLFGISSVIGWAAYGMNFASFLCGKKGEKIFTLSYPFFCIVGAVAKVDFVWRSAEFFNGIMLVINLFAVLMLHNEAILLLKGETNEKKNRKTAELSEK